MTSLKKLHAFCTKLEHYPSRLAIQTEIERLLAEEEKENPSVADRINQLATWAEKERDSTHIAFYHERHTYDTVAKRARALLDTLYGKEPQP